MFLVKYRMSLTRKFFTLIILLFTFFVAMIFFYADKLSLEINEKWGNRFVAQQLIFDKQKTLLPLMHEVALVKELSKEKAIIDMALNENNQDIYQKGIQTLEKYRLAFHNKTYFSAFGKTNHYYYNDKKNTYKNKELVYTLDKYNTNDAWFFKTLEQNKNFNINIDRDANTKVTNVWINYQIKHNGKVLGVIGTGFNLDKFLKKFVNSAQDGVHNLFIDEKLAIQLERNSNFIDYASISKLKEKCSKIDLYIKKPQELQQLKKILSELKNSNKKDKIETLWLTFKDDEYLVGVSYVKELDWFNITAVSGITLATINSQDITPIFIVLLVLLLIFIGVFLHLYIIWPINKIKYQMEDIEKNGYKDDLIILHGNDEISQLSKQFQQLLTVVSKHEHLLEDIVKERTDELYKKQQHLNTILDNVNAYIYIKDLNLRYIYVNKAMQEAMHEPLEKILHQDMATLYDELTTKKIKDIDLQTLQLGKRTESEEMIHKPGLDPVYVLAKKVPLYDVEGKIYGLLGVSTDITERKKYESMINQMAYYDTLTKLPNRRLLEDRISLMLAEVKRNKKFGALIFLDLDDFKNINDSYGHEVGDLLLIESSKRLVSSVRDIDTVARLGGDEFIIALGGLNEDREIAKNEALEIVQKILKITNEIYVINTIELVSTLSIGVTLFNDEDSSIDTILRRADKAMYKVKATNKNGVHII